MKKLAIPKIIFLLFKACCEKAKHWTICFLMLSFIYGYFNISLADPIYLNTNQNNTVTQRQNVPSPWTNNNSYNNYNNAENPQNSQNSNFTNSNQKANSNSTTFYNVSSSGNVSVNNTGTLKDHPNANLNSSSNLNPNSTTNATSLSANNLNSFTNNTSSTHNLNNSNYSSSINTSSPSNALNNSNNNLQPAMNNINSPTNNNNTISYNESAKAKWMSSCSQNHSQNPLAQKICECSWDRITTQIPISDWLTQNSAIANQMNITLKVILQECQVQAESNR